MVCDCAKIGCIYFQFFWRPKKCICFARKEILKEGKSAIFYLKQLGFSNWPFWQEEYIDKKRNVCYRIDNKHLGIFRDAETTFTLSLKIVSAIYIPPYSAREITFPSCNTQALPLKLYVARPGLAVPDNV